MFSFIKNKDESNVIDDKDEMVVEKNDIPEEVQDEEPVGLHSIKNINATAYLDANPDIVEAIKAGHFKDASQHLEAFGFQEIEQGIRQFHRDYAPFNEEVYLKAFKDINTAVKKKDFPSAFFHFANFGHDEILEGKRPWAKAENPPVEQLAYMHNCDDREDLSAEECYENYQMYKAYGYKIEAEDCLRGTIGLSQDPEHYHELALYLKQSKQWWQAVDAYANAIEKTDEVPVKWYEEYAFCLTQMNRHADAAKAWEQVLTEDNKNADQWFLYGYALELSGNESKANEAYANAIKYDADKNAKEFGIGVFYQKLGHWQQASEAYAKSVQEDPLHADRRYKLALSLDRCYKWEEAEKEYEYAIGFNPESIDWYYRLGFVRERQKKYDEAAEAYAYAAEHRKNHTPYWYYRLGYVLNKAGRYQESTEAFLMMKKIVVDLENSINIFEPNIEVYLPQSSLDEASDRPFLTQKKLAKKLKKYAFSLLDEEMTRDNVVKLLKRKLGKDYNDTQLWKLLFNDKNYKKDVYHYLIAESEKMEKEASKLKKEVEIQEKELEKQNHKLNASLKEIEILNESLKKDTTRDDLWFKLAKKYEFVNDYENAEYTYKRLIERKNNFDQNLYFSLGHILALQEKYIEASEIFKSFRILSTAHGVTEDPFKNNLEFKKLATYTEYYHTLKVDDNIIMYESFTANNVSGNPYAIFIKLLELEEYKSMLHVWAINDLSRVPQRFKSNPNILFIERDSDPYLRYLCKAKYLINNSGFPPYYIKKNDQKYLNTWHGTPLKTLGKEQKYKFFDHKRTQRNFLQASHIISPNPHTSHVLIHSYDLKNIYKGKVAETGYPRIDNTNRKNDEDKEYILSLLGVDTKTPIVLYAPTWRGTLQDVALDTKKLEDDISKLNKLDCQILFRGHSLLETVLEDSDLECITVPSIIDTNDLLSIVDILITDYSSIFFDFIAMKKPILYYIYDLEEYEEERGLYFEIEKMPGDKCHNIEELYNSLDKAVETMNIDEKEYSKAISKYCKYDDGNATNRVIDFFFNDKDNDVVHSELTIKDNNNVIIFPGSLLPNGITTSFINLVNQLDKNKINPIIPFSPNQIEKSPQGRESFSNLDYTLDFVPRYGNMLMTLEERYIRLRAAKNNYRNLALEEYDILKRMYQREFRRIFGNSKISSVINFSGYDEFWANISAFVEGVDHKIIYQHNDLYGEWKMKYPKLESIFNLYTLHDKIVSVSERTMKHNMDNLARLFNLDKKKFYFADNVQNYHDIIEKSIEELDNEDKSIFDNTKVFLNIGRLSPEKGHIKLIRAFKIIAEKYPEARLVNLGMGVQKNEIQDLIRELKLKDKVFYLGQKSNPYPYIKKSDCFILPSDHEGQPMTLFEAMILEKPIIATDIVGNRSVLEGRPGHLVENCEEGLIQGMSDFMEGNYQNDEVFDYKKYNVDALDMFYEKVLGDAQKII